MDCPAGKYKIDNSVDECYECNSGTRRRTKGTSSPLKCTTCPHGYIGHMGECTKLPPGAMYDLTVEHRNDTVATTPAPAPVLVPAPETPVLPQAKEALQCLSWCADHTDVWDFKCKWMKCRGCADCAGELALEAWEAQKAQREAQPFKGDLAANPEAKAQRSEPKAEAVATEASLQVVVKACFCDHGVAPAPGSECPGGHFCARCNSWEGYYLANGACAAKACTCSRGIGAVGVQCPRHGAEQCASCDRGLELVRAKSAKCVKPAGYTVPAFHYLRLYRECDQALLLGGDGVESCSRPVYADPASHQWAHKRRLPAAFRHGEALGVSCWAERFAGATSEGKAAASAELQCVNGEWFDRATGRAGLLDFKCRPCVQVAAPGYSDRQQQDKQELMWHRRIRTRMYSDSSSAGARLCLALNETGSGPSVVTLTQNAHCFQFLFKDSPASPSESRLVQVVDQNNRCLSGKAGEFQMELALEPCDPRSISQLFSARELSGILGKWQGDVLHGEDGDVPTILEPLGMDMSAAAAGEGKYCPVDTDATGRLVYEQDTVLASSPRRLQYSAAKGWCLGADCAEHAAVEPVGARGLHFEVVAITDFAGDFEGQGAAAPRTRAREAKKSRGAPRLPQEAPVELEVRPEGSQECKFEGLGGHAELFWEGAGGTRDQLPGGHPCAFAAAHSVPRRESASLRADRSPDAFGMDGREDRAGLGHDSLFSCDNREAARGNAEADISLAFGLDASLHGATPAAALAACSLAKDGAVAQTELVALGLGDACQRGSAQTTPVVEPGSLGVEAGGPEGGSCDPVAAGVARLYCDVHCVRDVAVQGDEGIMLTLGKATILTTQNLQAVSAWSEESMRTSRDWLAQKDWLARKLLWLSEYLDTGLDSSHSQLAAARAFAAKMLKEIRPLAQGASLGAASRASARRALQDFVGSAETVSNRSASVPQLSEFLEAVTALHATLRAGAQRSQRSSARLVLGDGVRRSRELNEAFSQTLGRYKRHSKVSKRLVREWSAARPSTAPVLVEADKAWWRLRDVLDEYIERAERLQDAYNDALDALTDYQECSSGFSELLAHYYRAMAERERSHELLRDAWRRSSDLIAQIASAIADADAFADSMSKEGCDSLMARRTLDQAKLASGAMHLLLHRFRAGGLPEPRRGAWEEAVGSISTSFEDTRRECEASGRK